MRSLSQTVARCADSIRSLSAELERLDLDESETETPLSDQPIVLVDEDFTTVVITTVHGVRDVVKVPRPGRNQ